jgi:thymidylate synthase ThyX
MNRVSGLYQKAIAAGVAREQARLFLAGFSVYYTWVTKTDAHNLMHFLSLRAAPDAQYEIRMYAQAIYEHFFKPCLPWTAEAYEQLIIKRLENNSQWWQTQPHSNIFIPLTQTGLNWQESVIITLTKGLVTPLPWLCLHGNPTWSFYYRNLINALKAKYSGHCTRPHRLWFIR